MKSLHLILALVGILCLLIIVFVAFLAFRTSKTKERIEDIYRREDIKRNLADSLYVFVGWPYCQHYMEHPDFRKKAVLVNPFEDINLDSSYMVPLSIFGKDSDTGTLYLKKAINDIPAGNDSENILYDYDGNAFIPFETTRKEF